MFSDPIIQSLLAGTVLGGFLGLAVTFVKHLVQVLIGLLLIIVIYILVQNGISSLELIINSILENIFAQKYFTIGTIIGLIIFFKNRRREE